nr:MAG TPA: hypothetical protein [Caudoviricetes sp.]
MVIDIKSVFDDILGHFRRFLPIICFLWTE